MFSKDRFHCVTLRTSGHISGLEWKLCIEILRRGLSELDVYLLTLQDEAQAWGERGKRGTAGLSAEFTADRLHHTRE